MYWGCLILAASAHVCMQLKRVARELGENMSDDELQSMLEHADKSKNGNVSFDDFYRLMKKKTSNKLDDLLGDDD